MLTLSLCYVLLIVLSIVIDIKRYMKYLKHLQSCMDVDDGLYYTQTRETVVWMMKVCLLIVAANILIGLIERGFNGRK